MSRYHHTIRIAAVLSAAVALSLASVACWEIEDDVAVEGNYDLTYDDVIRVYVADELVAEIDAAEGGEIPLGDGITLEYDELCADEDGACPSRDYWDEVAIYQPLGTDNALINAVNIDTIGEEGARLAGVVDADGGFTMLLGLSASGNSDCLVVGVSLAEGTFGMNPMQPVGSDTEYYDRIEDGIISVEYAAGCEITNDVVLATTLRFETGFVGARTGDVDLGEVEADPAIDEDGEELDEDPLVD